MADEAGARVSGTGQLTASYPRIRPVFMGVAVVAAVVVAAALVGRGLVFGQLNLVLLVLAAVSGLLLFERLSLTGWCTLLLLATVASRGVTVLLGLPGILRFAHYPVALAFGFAAAARPRPPQHLTHRAAARWLVGLLFVTTVSLVSSGSHPLRALVFLVIIGEPLFVLWAILRWGVDEASRRRVVRVGVGLLALQIPIGVHQGITLGWNDPVKGTLLGHGAGHHVLGGLFGLAALAALAAVLHRKIRPPAGVLGVATAAGMMVATGALSVVVITSVALVLMPLLTPRRFAALRAAWSAAPRIWSRAFVATLALVLAAAAIWVAQALNPGFLERARELVALDHIPEVRLVRDRGESDKREMIFGSGPGTGASRASLLLTPAQALGAGREQAGSTEGSPLASLNLPPTELGLRLASQTRNPWGGSAEDFASSAMAIVGDLGLLGFAALVAFYLALWQQAGRARTWITPAVRGALIMIAALMFVENWLEYPEFAVPLAILIGLALSDQAENQP